MSSSYTNPENQILPTPNLNRATEETDVRNWLTYWQNYLQTFFVDNNRLAGGTGLNDDNLADNAVHTRNLSINSNVRKFEGGSFNFTSVAGNFYNGLEKDNLKRSFAITFTKPSQVAEIDIETGEIWLQSGTIGTTMKFKLERSADINFASGVVKINNTANIEDIGRGYAGIGSYLFKFIDDDPTKIATTYYYRLMINYNYNGLVSHWNWQGYQFYKVYNSKSTF